MTRLPHHPRLSPHPIILAPDTDIHPTWLTHTHATLDRTIWAAYAWDDPDPAVVPEETILERLLALNGGRAGTDVPR